VSIALLQHTAISMLVYDIPLWISYLDSQSDSLGGKQV